MKNRDSNVLSMLEDKTNDYARKVALGMKTEFGWRELTFDGLGLLSRRIAAYLINDLGLKRNEKVAILSESKPEYGACIFAVIIAGLVAVPLDIKLTNHELTSILSDCLPSIIFVSQKNLAKAIELKKVIPSLRQIILVDENHISTEFPSIYTIPAQYTCKWRHRSRKSTALIVYTSGTTGKPKGVETTMGNIMSQLSDLKIGLDGVFPPNGDVKILSILPMNHLFELTVGFATFLNFGFSVYYTQSLKPKDVLNTIKDRKINFMILVPAFLKLLKTTLESEIKHSSKFYQRTFPIKYFIAKFIPFRFVKKLLFKKLHDCFGGSFMGCMSGGAPMDIKVANFFRRIGIEVFEGYGLTETSPVVTINFKKDRDIKSVGIPLVSYQTKVDEKTGELMLKGPSIMKGYHNQPELTANVIDKDGWFHTGDVAKIDNKGRVYITGRIKNMIVLSGGKKVYPEEVESVLEKSQLFEELCVIGYTKEGGSKDGTEEVAVVVVPKQEIAPDNETKEKMVRAEIKHLSQKLASYKRPTRIIVNETSLPRTATNKIRRKQLKEQIQNS